ncbi:uncharacterized protein LOC115575723 isoform X2 [Sparus aurata]|uniref:uncharacterized protein LOC115575723 isoform X2 n=1 Tax=Sparus aurata TaxID=8175 RepID=UPI0011C1092E|nr:uncharacterized protein LOC115575723 isoform X2 [Sparus aurata]
MFLLALATEGQERIFERIVYTRDQLIALCEPTALLPGARPEVLKELRRRRRGCTAGVKWRAKKRRHRPAVPAIVIGNVRSLGNKTDELAALIKSQREYRGSTKKTCPFCKGVLFCARKVCPHCKTEQPLKQRLKKKLQRFDDKREEWVVGRKKNHNVASIKDEATIMLEKLHAIGYKPVLLLGKTTKKEQTKCEILTPRCRLTDFAKDYLQKIGSFYEYLCEGWNQDPHVNEELITLHLTPCDPLEGPSNTNMEGQAEQTTWRYKQSRPTWRDRQSRPTWRYKQSRPTWRDRQSRATWRDKQSRPTWRDRQSRATWRDRQSRPTWRDRQSRPTWRDKQSRPTWRDRQSRPTWRDRQSRPTWVKSQWQQGICQRGRSYKKGKAEMLVEWEPCPVCGKEWAPSWQPKDSLQVV